MEILASPLPSSADSSFGPAAATTACQSLAQTAGDASTTQAAGGSEEVVNLDVADVGVVGGGDSGSGTGTSLGDIEVMDFGMGMDGMVTLDLELGQEWEHGLELQKILTSLGVVGSEYETQGPSELEFDIGMGWNLSTEGEGTGLMVF